MNYQYCCNWSYVRNANDDGMWAEGWVIYAIVDRRAVHSEVYRASLHGTFPTDLPYGIITAPRNEVPPSLSHYQLAGVCQECVQECVNHSTLKRWVELTKEV